MSNYKWAYGWSGHILVDKINSEGNVRDNVISVPHVAFLRLFDDFDRVELDHRIHAEQLGIREEGFVFLAVGGAASFTSAFQYYGTVFDEAELRVDGNPLLSDKDAEYLAAMFEVYGLKLPPCRLMVGCSS